MGVSQVTVIAAISLSGLLSFGCSKRPAPTTVKTHTPRPATVATNSSPPRPAMTARGSNVKDLGALDLTNRFETFIDLGGGRSCTITPRLIDKNNLQLTLVLQSKSADGKTDGIVVTQVSTHPGQPFEAAVGDMDITLTPNIGQQ